MRILSLPFAAFALLAAVPASAEGPGLFSLFKGVCEPGLDADGVAKRAAAQGFAPAKKAPKADGLTDAKAFEKTIGGQDFFVIAGRRADKAKDGMPATSTLVCGAGLKGKDEAGLAAGGKWAGVPAEKSMMGVSIYVFTQAGGRKVLSLKDKAATRAAVTAGDLHTLTASGFGGTSMLLLTRTAPAK